MTVSASVINADYQHILFRSAGASEIAAWSNVDTNAEGLLAGIEHSSEALTFVDPLIRLYQGAFDRAPDVSGLDANVNAMRGGHLSIYDMANAFVNSAEFVNTYGALSDEQYVEQLYQNVLGRAGSQAEVAAWLATGADRAHILVGFTNRMSMSRLRQRACSITWISSPRGSSQARLRLRSCLTPTRRWMHSARAKPIRAPC